MTLEACKWRDLDSGEAGLNSSLRLMLHCSTKVGKQSYKAHQPDFVVNNKGTNIVHKSIFGIGGGRTFICSIICSISTLKRLRKLNRSENAIGIPQCAKGIH